MAKEDTSTVEAAPDTPRRKKLMVPGIIAVVMIVEGVGIFGAMKMFGAGPGSAAAMESIEGLDEETDSKDVEVQIAEFNALNEKSGVTFLVDISVSARVPADRAAEIRGLLNDSRATIVDRLTQAVRSVNANHLKEEDLATIRRKMKFELDKVLEDETMISELLITRFQKFRADL